MKPEAKKLAREIAQDSIVTDALTRYTEQIMETAVEHKNSEISKLRDALAFYANHNHWMGVAGDSDYCLNLCAMKGPSPMQGWTIAEEALKK